MGRTSLPCKRLTTFAVVAQYQEKPVSRGHLVLLDGTCRQFVLVCRSSEDLVTQELSLPLRVLGCNEKDICLVFVAALEVGDSTKSLGGLRVDEVLALIDKVNTVGVADALWGRVF